MKMYTFPAFLVTGLLFISLGSCKKPATVKPDKPAPVISVNPDTAVTTCDYDFNETDLTSSGWTKTFDDEFTGDLSNWLAYTGGVQNEYQCYEPANAQIVNGALQLTAKHETVTGPTIINAETQKTFNYTSGALVSNQTFSASSTTPKVRIVARVKAAVGYGMVSLFQSYGVDWPTNGEINLFQIAGDDLKVYGTNYFYGNQPGKNLVNNSLLFNPTDGDLSTCWHVYTMEWTKTALNYYLDGKLVEAKTTGGYIPEMYGKAQNISLSLAIGGLFYDNFAPANIQTGTLYVDYVKVFTSN